MQKKRLRLIYRPSDALKLKSTKGRGKVVLQWRGHPIFTVKYPLAALAGHTQAHINAVTVVF